MFACIGATKANGVSVTCADVETAALLIERGRALRAPHFHRIWVRLPWGLVPQAELHERLQISHQIIRSGLMKSGLSKSGLMKSGLSKSGLSKKLQASLGGAV